jgi:hypothetical protein
VNEAGLTRVRPGCRHSIVRRVDCEYEKRTCLGRGNNRGCLGNTSQESPDVDGVTSVPRKKEGRAELDRQIVGDLQVRVLREMALVVREPVATRTVAVEDNHARTRGQEARQFLNRCCLATPTWTVNADEPGAVRQEFDSPHGRLSGDRTRNPHRRLGAGEE